MRLGPAHAKLNLALEVLGRREDGFHELRSVVVAIDWHDLVGVRIMRGAGVERLHRIEGETAEPGMGAPGSLVARAAAALERLADAAGASSMGVDVSVVKRVAVAAGLGGGSSDAAAILRLGAAELSDGGVLLDPAALAAVAAELGSDVPALLAGGASLMAGRGELLRPLPPVELHLAVAVVAKSSTTASYAALDAADLGDSGRAERVAVALLAGRQPAMGDLGSALEVAACRAAPGLADSLRRLRGVSPEVCWHLTGSGGAAFAVASGADDARRIVELARRAGLGARRCRTVTASA